MIQISNIPLPPDTDFARLSAIAARITGLPEAKIRCCRLVKRSVDARKKPEVFFVCTLAFETDREERAIRTIRWKHTTLVSQKQDAVCISSGSEISESPVIVGSGPAGLFAALVLAQAGCRPVVLERGDPAPLRIQKVNTFWQQGRLDCESNVQFGEGGAGTFSDGKLNTGTKDPRNRFVLETFVRHGAPEEILWEARPHVGTDKLVAVVSSMRQEIIALGGQVLFRHRLTDILTEKDRLVGVAVQTPEGNRTVSCRQLVLAPGHSARDTIRMLYQKGVAMEQKPFSLGVRIEHPQSMINFSQYGDRWGVPPLPAAEYKLSTHLSDGRGVYTFCMCPGGRVVASASQAGGVCTNGMSVFARDGENANSGLLVGIGPKDFPDGHPLAGVGLQERVEQAAFAAGGGNYYAPVQLAGDFLRQQPSCTLGEVAPTYQPGVTFCPLEDYLPPVVTHALRQALPVLGQKLNGFDRADALLTGPETRSSSPVRMTRDETYQSSIRGIYPCGEGAGYAGGITSAAADGIRVALSLLDKKQI